MLDEPTKFILEIKKQMKSMAKDDAVLSNIIVEPWYEKFEVSEYGFVIKKK